MGSAFLDALRKNSLVSPSHASDDPVALSLPEHAIISAEGRSHISMPESMSIGWRLLPSRHAMGVCWVNVQLIVLTLRLKHRPSPCVHKVCLLEIYHQLTFIKHSLLARHGLKGFCARLFRPLQLSLLKRWSRCCYYSLVTNKEAEARRPCGYAESN